MAKSSPEKLAQALRANLKRRKALPDQPPAPEPPPAAGQAPQKPPQKPG